MARRTGPGVSALGGALAAAVLAAAACADLGSDPDRPVALEFEGIPFPALITGDTMRDSLGVATPLTGRAFNGRGGEIAGAPIDFLTRDTGVVIDAAGFLRATRRSGTVRLLASVEGLQSRERTVEVTLRPDTLVAPATTRITYTYALPDAATNVAPEMRVTLRSDAALVGESPAVRGWLVRWRVVRGSDTLSQGDTTRVVLQGTTGRRSALDTTKADGTSARRLRVFANTITPATDSFVVLAEVRRHGVPVRGSPVRFVVLVSP